MTLLTFVPSMKTRTQNTVTRINWRSLVLTLVFLYGVVSAHFFVHPHTVDGRLIVHSHPYQKNTGADGQLPASHQHTAHGFLLVQALDNTLPDFPAEAPGLCFFSWEMATSYAPEVVSLVLPLYSGASLWRAPPWFEHTTVV